MLFNLFSWLSFMACHLGYSDHTFAQHLGCNSITCAYLCLDRERNSYRGAVSFTLRSLHAIKFYNFHGYPLPSPEP